MDHAMHDLWLRAQRRIDGALAGIAACAAWLVGVAITVMVTDLHWTSPLIVAALIVIPLAAVFLRPLNVGVQVAGAIEQRDADELARWRQSGVPLRYPELLRARLMRVHYPMLGVVVLFGVYVAIISLVSAAQSDLRGQTTYSIGFALIGVGVWRGMLNPTQGIIGQFLSDILGYPVPVFSDPTLARQLAQSAPRVLDRFAGDPQNATAHRSGLAGVATLVEENVPPAQQEQAARAMLHILDGTLMQLLQAARQKAGLAPLDMTLPRNQAFMHQVVTALSEAPLYPETVLFTLQAFHPVPASVFQVTRAPGKRVVYAGSILLVAGVLAMLYVRERRLWIWLEPGPQEGTAQALMAYSSNRRNPQSNQEFARLSTLLAGEPMHDHCP